MLVTSSQASKICEGESHARLPSLFPFLPISGAMEQNVGMLSLRPEGPTLEARRAESGEGFLVGSSESHPQQLKSLRAL